jgi:hypothetical protein
MPAPRLRLLLPIALLASLLSACNFPRAGSTPSSGPETVLTYAAQTVEAQLTLAAGELQPTITPSDAEPSVTPEPGDTATPPPDATTPAPTEEATPEVCDRGAFVKDVNYPDDTVVEAGEVFTKTWRLENAGTCTWNSDYAVIFDHGDAMEGPASQELTDGTVPPGEDVDVSIAFRAPDESGDYQGFWKLRNPAGEIFGLGSNADKEFWVKVQVGVISGITYDFIARASSADWVGSGGGEEITLTFGGADDDGNGVAKISSGFKLEDGITVGRTLVVHPKHNDDGKVVGTFSEYTIREGDHFKAKLAFVKDCGDGQVTYQLRYREGGETTTIEDWDETCNGKGRAVDVDLSDLAGKKVKFVLTVLADGSSQDDLVVWGSARIER